MAGGTGGAEVRIVRHAVGPIVRPAGTAGAARTAAARDADRAGLGSRHRRHGVAAPEHLGAKEELDADDARRTVRKAAHVRVERSHHAHARRRVRRIRDRLRRAVEAAGRRAVSIAARLRRRAPGQGEGARVGVARAHIGEQRGGVGERHRPRRRAGAAAEVERAAGKVEERRRELAGHRPAATARGRGGDREARLVAARGARPTVLRARRTVLAS